MASSSSDDSSHAHVLDLPADLSICVLRRLEGWDLVAACTASAVWATQVAAEELWRNACEIRWPHTFGPHTEAAVRPLAMPAWLEKVSHFRAQRRTGIMAPPGPHARLVEWRAYYLEHDLFEALNVAPAFLAADELHQLHAVLERNLQLFSPRVCSVRLLLSSIDECSVLDGFALGRRPLFLRSRVHVFRLFGQGRASRRHLHGTDGSMESSCYGKNATLTIIM